MVFAVSSEFSSKKDVCVISIQETREKAQVKLQNLQESVKIWSCFMSFGCNFDFLDLSFHFHIPC